MALLVQSFCESDSEIKELTILRQLKQSHFQHSHLCQILDVAIEPQSVCNYSGKCVFVCVFVRVCVCVCVVHILYVSVITKLPTIFLL